MKRYYFIAFILLAAIWCGCGRNSGSGELLGARGHRVPVSRVPYGMVYIPGGTFIMGQTDQDITFAQIAQNKQVTVQAFYMDDTEISNSEYRQFVNWVRDSIAQTDFLQDPRYFVTPRNQSTATAGTQRNIDWKKIGNGSRLWSTGRGSGANANKLQAMYYQGPDRIFNKNEIDVRLLKYQFSMMQYRTASNKRFDRDFKRSDAILNDTVSVYPDTLVWLNDYTYAANEPMVRGYFSHPAFDNYPVVGITWRQARAFTVWRTQWYENSLRNKEGDGRSYELPTEAQFEYAARGGRVGTVFPWGMPYIRNAKGCLLANFKPGRGNYVDDGGVFTVNVKSYFPNDFGLYNMAGNVAEWTSSTFDESSTQFVHDLNPTYNYEAQPGDPAVLRRKTVKGGSWKDVGFFLQNSASTYEYQDTAKSYIGFRCVSSFQGRDIHDKR